MTWTGEIEEGGMGPGTPAQIANGTATHHWIQNGRWVVGEFEQDQFLEDGTFVLKWELHWVSGWDPANAEYRATVADCYGHTEIMRGPIEGDFMIFESMRDTMAKVADDLGCILARVHTVAERDDVRRCGLDAD